MLDGLGEALEAMVRLLVAFVGLTTVLAMTGFVSIFVAVPSWAFIAFPSAGFLIGWVVAWFKLR